MFKGAARLTEDVYEAATAPRCDFPDGCARSENANRTCGGIAAARHHRGEDGRDGADAGVRAAVLGREDRKDVAGGRRLGKRVSLYRVAACGDRVERHRARPGATGGDAGGAVGAERAEGAAGGAELRVSRGKRGRERTEGGAGLVCG